MRVPARPFLLILFASATIPAGSARVFGGHATTDYKCVGMIGKYDGSVFQQSGCGVAIGRDWILSVAHVNGDVYIQNGRRFSVQQRYAYYGDVDLALFKLTEPIRYKASMSFPTFNDLKGKMVNLVGYGNDAKKRSDGQGWQPIGGTNGMIRVANNVIDDLQNPGSTSAQQALMYDLDPPKGSTPNTLGGKAIHGEGGIAGHDSGGGWFVTIGGQPRLVAISDSVSIAMGNPVSPYCYGGLGYGIYLAPYRGWINKVTGLSL